MITKYLIVAWLAIGALSVVANVGKPRRPITPGTAAFAVALNAAIAVAIVICWPTN